MSEATGPLAGVIIADLTQAWAGTYLTQLLGDLGAEVIKVESRRRPDIWRGGVDAYQRGIGVPGDRPFNRHPNTNSVCRNKRGITLDLTHPRGRELFLNLVRMSDVVAENYTPRVMRNWGMDYASLLQYNPDLIMISMPAYGSGGPYSEYPGIGSTIEPMSGNSAVMGEPGGPPTNSGYLIPDPLGGLTGAAAVMTALEARAAGRGGQYINLSLHEAMTGVIGDILVEAQRSGSFPRRGDTSARHVPSRHYESRDGRWLAISVESDDEWERLAAAIGLADGVSQRFATAETRLANRDAVDHLVEAWIGQVDADDAEARLIHAGVRCGKVRPLPEVAACPQLAARGMFVEIPHSEMGSYRTAGLAWKFSHTPATIRLGAPCLGEHSREVLTGLLGVSESEYQELVAAGVTGDQPPGG